MRLLIDDPDLDRGQRQPGTMPELPLHQTEFRSHADTLPLSSCHHTMPTRCEEIMREVCTDFEAELKQFNGEEDHVHLLVHHPPKAQLSQLVNSLKGVSARLPRKEYDTHVRRYLWGGHFWSSSYFAGSCGGEPLTVVQR
ncbi:IS200/IS605 family transposase [Streptomyces roseirectus]|uniref:IS200/IS605 family transposase n=1 Tax=Streptomyces roseirectus TaxID=2768066 RepID=UPI003CCDA55E